MKAIMEYTAAVMAMLMLGTGSGYSAQQPVHRNTLRIETTGYGQVGEKIKASGVTDCDTLVIAGPMDIDDFSTVKNFVPDSGSGIEMLDLREATLKDNEVPDKALWRSDKVYENPETSLKIRNIRLPEGIVRIGIVSLACLDIKTVNIPSSVREIGSAAFEADSCLDCKLEIPYGVDTIASGLFLGCFSLNTAPKLPETIKCIKMHAFTGSGIEDITLPEGLKYIGEEAFSFSRVKKIELPSTCKMLGVGAFYRCYQLEELDMRAASVEYLPFDLACECSNLRIIRFPRNCKAIGWGAFAFCNKVEIVECNEGLESIDDFAFSSGELKELTLPSTMKSVGVLSRCPKLLTIYCKAMTPPKFSYGEGNLTTNVNKATLYVPSGTKEAYAAADGWKDFYQIVELSEFPDAGTDPCIADKAINDNRIYDLNGIEVNDPLPGKVYIHKGKKVKF